MLIKIIKSRSKYKYVPPVGRVYIHGRKLISEPKLNLKSLPNIAMTLLAKNMVIV